MDSQAGQEKRIQILFAEYRALGAEVIQRGSWLIQICTVAGTVTIAIVGFGFAYKAPFTGLILFFVTLTLLVFGLSASARITFACESPIQ